MSRNRIFAIPLLFALLAVGCKTATIYNPRVAFAPRDEHQVEDAILKALANQALAKRPWISRKEKPGVIIAILSLRLHQAVVRIEYGPSFYSIRHVDSKELLYERKANGEEVIHKNYNVWIELLVNDINAFLELYERSEGSAS
jgi:hypothetical protein